MSVRKFDDFDPFAKAYRETHTENLRISGADSFYFAEMKVKLLIPYESNMPLKILDVGCGDGTTEVFIKKYFPQWQITGIDISMKSIEEARSKNIPGANFFEYNGNVINLPNESVDIIFMAGVLHHISFDLHGKMMKEITRVLSKGGRFYFFEHNPINPLTRYLVNTCVFDKDAKLVNFKYAESLLKQHDLQIIATNFIIFFPRKGLLSHFIFLEKYLTKLPLGGQYFIAANK